MSDMSKALAKASTTKFTIQEKKMIVDAIKVRYNGILRALADSITDAADKQGGRDYNNRFPIEISDCRATYFKAKLKAGERSKFEKLVDSIRAFEAADDKKWEAIERVANGIRSKGRALQSQLESERDQLIFQVSLLGSSVAANEIIDSLRSPEDIASQVAEMGVEITTEAMQITGIGYPSPKQIGE